MNWYTVFWFGVFVSLVVLVNFWARKYYTLLKEYLAFKKEEYQRNAIRK